MSLISDTFIDHLNNNKNKKFLYSLDSDLDGSNCLDFIFEVKDFLSNSNHAVAIASKNNHYWPLIYIAARSLSKPIFLIDPSLNSKQKKDLKEKYPISTFFENIDFHNGFNSSDVEQFNNHSTFDIDRNSDILFTSGTTGEPKAAVISENAYLHVAKTLIKELSQNQNHIELLSMPFYHSFGLTRLRTLFLSGCSGLVVDGLKNFPEVYNFAKDNNLSGLSLVPSAIEVVRSMLRKKTKEFTSNIQYLEIGSSSISKEARIWLKENFDTAKIIHHYGMTECSRAFLRKRGAEDDFEAKDNWLGSPLSDCEYKISSSGNQGELLLRGKNLFSGYLDQEFNKSKYIDGWVRTGDICRIEEDQVFLEGRIDNQINVGGQKIQAELVESILEEISCVNASICFATEDKLLGSKVLALVRLNQEIEYTSLKKEIDEVFSNHPSYFKPSDFLIVDTIPKTKNGKKKRNLNELLTIYHG